MTELLFLGDLPQFTVRSANKHIEHSFVSKYHSMFLNPSLSNRSETNQRKVSFSLSRRPCSAKYPASGNTWERPQSCMGEICSVFTPLISVTEASAWLSVDRREHTHRAAALTVHMVLANTSSVAD